ncbi:hypothetical protein Tco_1309821 [Tanacetum coccineum]
MPSISFVLLWSNHSHRKAWKVEKVWEDILSCTWVLLGGKMALVGDYAGYKERDVCYRIIDTWDEMLVNMPGAPTTDDRELGRRMTEFTTRVRQDTYEIYTRLDDEQSERQLMAGRMSQEA